MSCSDVAAKPRSANNRVASVSIWFSTRLHRAPRAGSGDSSLRRAAVRLVPCADDSTAASLTGLPRAADCPADAEAVVSDETGQPSQDRTAERPDYRVMQHERPPNAPVGRDPSRLRLPVTR